MTTYKTPLEVGVFQEEPGARRAVETLRNANFAHDQIGVAMLNKNTDNNINLVQDLINLGLPQEQANYYESEFKNGRIVVSVRPDGRSDEARQILENNGAYNYTSQSASQQEQPRSGDMGDYSWSNATVYGEHSNQAPADNFGQADYRQTGNYGEGASYAPQGDKYRNEEPSGQ